MKTRKDTGYRTLNERRAGRVPAPGWTDWVPVGQITGITVFEVTEYILSCRRLVNPHCVSL